MTKYVRRWKTKGKIKQATMHIIFFLYSLGHIRVRGTQGSLFKTETMKDNSLSTNGVVKTCPIITLI